MTATAIPVEGRHLCGLAWLDDLLWYSDGSLHEIIAVDPGTGDVAGRLPCPEVRTGLAAAHDGSHLVQVVEDDKRLRAIDHRTGDVLAEYPNPRPGDELCGIHDTAAGLWLGYQRPAVIERRRFADMELVDSFPVDGDVADLTVAGDRVVFAGHPEARLNVLDPASGRVTERIPVTGNPTGLTWDGHRLWYCDFPGRALRAVVATGAGEGLR